MVSCSVSRGSWQSFNSVSVLRHAVQGRGEHPPAVNKVHLSTMTSEVLLDNFEGRQFNSPNDVVLYCDGSIWFTGDWEGCVWCGFVRVTSQTGVCYQHSPGLGSHSVQAAVPCSYTRPPQHTRVFPFAQENVLAPGIAQHKHQSQAHTLSAAASHAHCDTSVMACCLSRLPPDPPYGHAQNFRPAPELGQRVYAFHPSTGAVSVVAEGFVMPNGIAFAPDFKTLYVSDTGKENVSTGRD